MDALLKDDYIYIKKGLYSIKDYYNYSGNERIELIEGMIYAQASPSLRHQIISRELITDINNFIRKNKGNCEVFGAPLDVILTKKNIFQPDVFIVCDKEKLNDRGCKGAPDFIIEIVSPSNAQDDYIRKLNVYWSVGVREYWIIDPIKERILVWFFEESSSPTLYSLFDEIPVAIYDGALKLRITQ